MFSKAELEYLKCPEKFDSDYGRVLKCRINAKIQLRDALLLLQGDGLNVTENCNDVTQYCNNNQSLNQASNSKRVEDFGALAELWRSVYDALPQNHGSNFEDSYLNTSKSSMLNL